MITFAPKYDRPQPHAVLVDGEWRAVTWAELFRQNQPAPGSSLDEAIELLRAFVAGEVGADRTRAVGRTLLLELGVITP